MLWLYIILQFNYEWGEDKFSNSQIFGLNNINNKTKYFVDLSISIWLLTDHKSCQNK